MTSLPILSIVIPTHKRAEILAQCLDNIEKQTMRDKLEVIVVSDGRDEQTAALFAQKTWQVPVKFLEIEKSQQGVARNRGVKEARGPITLFIGDDIFLEPDACEKHLAAHDAFNGTHDAVLGFTTWDPILEITPVMRWLEASGWQFGYPMIAPYAHQFIPKDIQQNFTYTSHVSLPTDIALAHRFREDVSLYGWEDIEWGMRLKSAGVRLFYEPGAKAFHHHRMTLEDSLKRMETLGQSGVLMERRVSGLNVLPKGWKFHAYKVLSLLPTLSGKHRRAFLKGIKRT